MTTLSIIIPVYMGEKFLRQLVLEIDELRLLVAELQMPLIISQAIFVVDDAIDDSADLLDDLAKEFDWVSVFHLSRNFGQHAAIAAGVEKSSGDWVATIDEDLQHRPHMILDLLKEAIIRGADVCYGNGKSNIHGGYFRDLASVSIKKLTRFLFMKKETVRINSFRVIRGEIARAAFNKQAHDIYLDVVLQWYTTRLVSVSLDLIDIRHVNDKTSGYTLMALFAHARRMIMSEQIKVLRVGMLLGLLAIFFSVGYPLFIAIKHTMGLYEVSVRGWPSLMVTTSFFGGLSLFLLTILLEYVAFISARAKGHPNHFICDRSGDRELQEYFAARDHDTLNRNSID